MQHIYLNQLAAYLRLLGKQRLPQVMLSAVHLQRLILALVYVAELDCSGISILEDFSTKSKEEDKIKKNLSFLKKYIFMKFKI